MKSTSIAIFEKNQFTIKEEAVPELSPTSVLLEQLAVGVNDIDIVNAKKSKNSFGQAACGIIKNMGDKVKGFNIGDSVVYVTAPGGFKKYRTINYNLIVKISDNIDPKVAIATVYGGCVAHMVAVRTFIVRGGLNVLVWDIHSPVGKLIGILARKKGAKVIGVTATDSTISAAACDVVIRQDNDVVKNIMKITNNIGVHVSYNGLNTPPLEGFVDAMIPSGVVVDYLGVTVKINSETIAIKSLFYTVPSLIHYKSIRSELILTVHEALALVEENPIEMNVIAFPLSDINKAFGVVAEGKNSDAIVVVP